MSFKIVKKTPEEIMAAQKKREEEMREREAKRKQEVGYQKFPLFFSWMCLQQFSIINYQEEAKKAAAQNATPVPVNTANLSRAEQERLKAEREYEEQQLKKKQAEEERRKKEGKNTIDEYLTIIITDKINI